MTTEGGEQGHIREIGWEVGGGELYALLFGIIYNSQGSAYEVT